MKPKRYRALHITPGVVDYTDGDQRETVLIKKPALDNMNRSFLGKPVFNFTHKAVSIKDAFDFTSEETEEHAVGVISDVGYDVDTGYYFADMMIWDEATQDNIASGYKVSNAYIPDISDGGVYNNVPYDEEVVGGEYDHMAIVEDPRYGDVKIFENAKGENKMSLFKLITGKGKSQKKNEADPPPVEDPKENEDDMSMNMDSILVDEEGNEYPLAELVETYKSTMGKENEEEKPTINMEDTVEIDGKEVSVKDLYDNFNSKKNAEPPTDQPLEDAVDETQKKNSADSKSQNESFLKIKANAQKGAEPEKIQISSERSRIARGKNRYGSTPAAVQGGN